MFRFDQMDKISQYYGSQRVQVRRLTPTTWDVSTNPFTDYSDPFGSSYHTAGDLAVLAPYPSTPLGLYHLPFGATVTCLSPNTTQNPNNCPP